MSILFLGTVLIAFIVFTILNRVTIFSLLFLSGLVYFSPLFFGFYIEKFFFEDSTLHFERSIDARAYLVGTWVLFLNVLFHIVVFYRFKNNLKLRSYKNAKIIILFAGTLALLVQVILLIKVVGETGENKHHLMQVTASLLNLKIFFQLIMLGALSLSYQSFFISKRRYIYLIIFMIAPLIIFDIYIGYRYTTIYALCMVFIIFYYNKHYSIRYLFKGGLTAILILLFFSAVGNIRNEIREFNFSSLYEKVSSLDWWLWGVRNMEPMFQFNIINSTIESNLQCDGITEVSSQLIGVFIPLSKYFIEIKTFHDCFVPEISPFFPQIASNLWAQLYSYAGWVGLIIGIVMIYILFYFFAYLMNARNNFFMLFGVLMASVLSIYIQRSELMLIFVTTYRVFLAIVILWGFTLLYKAIFFKRH